MPEHHDRAASFGPLLAAFAGLGIPAVVEAVGGGDNCLHIPVSEDGSKFVWLGCDDDGAEPLWVDSGFQPFWSGCVYLDQDDDTLLFAGLDTIEVDVTSPLIAAQQIVEGLLRPATIAQDLEPL